MNTDRLHPDELGIDVPLVRRLVADQFPTWADLRIEPVASGTDNAIFRLGESLAARMPRVDRAVGRLAKERKWLPRLAPHLPLDVPVPLADGHPGHGYPWPWSVYRWLDGSPLDTRPVRDLCDAAGRTAQFVRALRAVDASDGPAPGEHNFWRGVPLAERDSETRAAIERLGAILDATAARHEWEASLEAPAWREPPVWIHGDLLPGNLLAVGGRVTAVIDFGGLGVGDPACDLMAAWTLLSGHSRRMFREALGLDDAAWSRGRGWALSWA